MLRARVYLSIPCGNNCNSPGYQRKGFKYSPTTSNPTYFQISEPSEAIVLALRNNPNVHSSRLQRINDKYALELANYAFQPHFNISGNTVFTKGEKTGYNFNPGVSLATKWGTQLSINNTTDLKGTQQEQVSVTQPLLRGFGAVNGFSWLNTQDSELIARLSFKTSITDIITQVITTYRQVVQDYNNLKVQKTALRREEQTEKQYRLRTKSGKMAPSELLQEQANLANTRLETLRQENTAQQDYQTLLDTLGLSPNSHLKLDTNINFHAYKTPTKEQAIEIALNNNPQYVTQTIQINAAERAVQSAKNDLWWQLDVSAQSNLVTSHGNFPGVTSLNELSTTDAPSITLQLSIPFREIDKKAALVKAKVALAQAQDALEQNKRTLTRQVINDLNNLNNLLDQLNVAALGISLQRKNFNAEQIKQRYGQTTALNVNIIQDQLLQQEINFVNSQIGYLNSVTEFENLLGKTLNDWGVELRY